MKMETAAAEGQDKSVLVLSYQFFPIFDETDDHDYGRPGQADKKHDFKQPHCQDNQLHRIDCSAISTSSAAVRLLKQEERRQNSRQKRRELAVSGDGLHGASFQWNRTHGA
jgi:hypothetical protein